MTGVKAWTVEGMTGTIGAVIDGVDLRTDDGATIDAIQKALHEHLVLVFPGRGLTPFLSG